MSMLENKNLINTEIGDYYISGFLWNKRYWLKISEDTSKGYRDLLLLKTDQILLKNGLLEKYK